MRTSDTAGGTRLWSDGPARLLPVLPMLRMAIRGLIGFCRPRGRRRGELLLRPRLRRVDVSRCLSGRLRVSLGLLLGSGFALGQLAGGEPRLDNLVLFGDGVGVTGNLRSGAWSDLDATHEERRVAGV